METDRPVNTNKDRRDGNGGHTDIEFSVIETSVILPPRMKSGGCAIRAIWFGYDHYSDTADSFFMPMEKEALSLRRSAKVECLRRKEILAEALQKACDEIDEQGLDDFLKPEPYEINVDKLYAEYEDNLNKITRTAMGPLALHLEECDINLRCQRIVGGVYLIDLIEQPQQDIKLDSHMFIRTINHPNTIKHNSFYQTYKAPQPIAPGIRRLPEEIEAEIRMVEMNLDKLILITIQLTDNIFWFEPPIVCRWESASELQSNVKSNDQKTVILRKSNSENSTRNATVKHIDDFNLFEMPCGLDMPGLMHDFVMPRIPNGFCIKIESLDQTKRNSILKYLDNEPNKNAAVNKRNFSTNIRGFLQPIDVPHPLIPTKIIKQQLNVIKKETEAADIETLESASQSCYMFSQLLEDLDELCDELIPYSEDYIEEVISVLTTAKTESVEEEPPEVEYYGFSIMREANEAKLKAEAEAAAAAARAQEEQEEDEWSDDSTTENDTKTNQHRPSDSATGKWTTRDIHDLKFNEEKLSIQFRAGRFGMFAFAVNRHCNLPFQSWEIRPDLRNPGTVTFTLTAAVISIDVTISVDGVRLNSFQGGVSNIVQAIVGQTMKIEELQRTLRSAAIDLFPDNDAFCYAEGTCEKHYPMECHLYECMSMLALTHSFSWSRWNLLAGSRNAVLLTREVIEHRKLPTHSTLHVTPLKSAIVECTELSSSFSPKPAADMEYYADVYHLGLAISQPVSLAKQESMHPVLRENIIKMLKRVRPLSFS